MRPKTESRGGSVEQPGLRPQPRARAIEARDGIRRADPRAQPPPELGLPAVVRAAGPGPHERGPVERVAVEQPGEVAHGGEAPGAPGVASMWAASRCSQGSWNDASTTSSSGQTIRSVSHGSASGSMPAAVAIARVTTAPRRREVHVRAHAVGAPAARAQPVRHALRQPPLHPARRHGDQLGRERVGQRFGEQRAQRLDEAVRPFRPMDVQHRPEV